MLVNLKQSSSLFLLSLRNMKLHYTWIICLWIVAVDSTCICHCGLCTYSWPLGNNYSMIFSPINQCCEFVVCVWEFINVNLVFSYNTHTSVAVNYVFTCTTAFYLKERNGEVLISEIDARTILWWCLRVGRRAIVDDFEL